MKKCKRCDIEKPLTEYYKHSGMKDGHLNICKDCKRKESIQHRNDNIEKVRAYDRKRGNRQCKSYLKEYRNNNKEKYKAHNKVNNAIRDGKLKKENCEVCGTSKKVHAHHDDYSKPLDVRWLCPKHHRQHHTKKDKNDRRVIK